MLSGCERFGFRRDQVLLSYQCRLHQGIGREQLTESLTVGSGDGLPVVCIAQVHSGADDIALRVVQ